MIKVFSICFLILVMLYLYTNDLMEWALYFIAFVLCCIILLWIIVVGVLYAINTYSDFEESHE